MTMSMTIGCNGNYDYSDVTASMTISNTIGM
jgi:hypothetical protein